MSVKFYTNIIITGNSFSIVNCDQKSKGALSTLSSIAEVIRKGLQYREDFEDEFSQLPTHELYATLRQQAKGIRDRYIEKTSTLSLFKRFFGRVSKKERVIQATFDRIVLLAEPPPVLELPNELIQHIFGFLQTSTLGKVAQVNKHGKNHVKQTQIQRAREYGYKGRDFAEAKDYLHNLFQSFSTLVKGGHIPEEYVVVRGRWLFWRFVDSEATLRNIIHFKEEKRDRVKIKLNEALLHYSKMGNRAVCKTLIYLGSDINVRDQDGRTALALAAKKGKKDVVEFLIDRGADVNTTNIWGNTPLLHACVVCPEIIRLLLEHGGYKMIDHINNHGNNALHYAVLNGRLKIVQLLVVFGADLTLLNAQGKTAYELANSHQMRRLLQ